MLVFGAGVAAEFFIGRQLLLVATLFVSLRGTQKFLLPFFTLSRRSIVFNVSYVLLGSILALGKLACILTPSPLLLLFLHPFLMLSVPQRYLLQRLLLLHLVFRPLHGPLHIGLHAIVNVCRGSNDAVIDQIVAS